MNDLLKINQNLFGWVYNQQEY